jgi:hypothetical protein
MTDSIQQNGKRKIQRLIYVTLLNFAISNWHLASLSEGLRVEHIGRLAILAVVLWFLYRGATWAKYLWAAQIVAGATVGVVVIASNDWSHPLSGVLAWQGVNVTLGILWWIALFRSDSVKQFLSSQSTDGSAENLRTINSQTSEPCEIQPLSLDTALRMAKHPEDIVYLQFSESGAMGSPGSIVIGTFESEKLICYVGNMAEEQWFNRNEFYDAMDFFYSLACSTVHNSIHTKTPADTSFSGVTKPAMPRDMFAGAFDLGNYLLLNRKLNFSYDKDMICCLKGPKMYSIHTTSAPISIFGPLLFEHGHDGLTSG